MATIKEELEIKQKYCEHNWVYDCKREEFPCYEPVKCTKCGKKSYRYARD